MNLGENIYKYRTQRNLSQGDLADALDVSRQSVSKWENNNAVPDLDRLVKMAGLFEITLDELVTGKKPEPEVITLPAPPVPAQRPITLRMILGFLFFIMAGITLVLSLFISLLSLLFSLPLAVQFATAGILCLLPHNWDAYSVCWYGSVLTLPLSILFDIFMGFPLRTAPNLLLIYLCRRWRRALDEEE